MLYDKNNRAATSSLSDLSGCSEKVTDQGQILTIFLAIAGTIGQKIGELWIGLRLLQSARLKSDRTLAFAQK